MSYSINSFYDGKITLFGGDNREVLIDAPDDSVDSVLTDGPYALVSIVKRFGGANAAPAKGNAAFTRASKGFMGKTWDTGEVVNDPAFWAECLRVLKPGGHLLSFGGTRTYHRMACAVEDAGFEIRDMIQWLYGSGFPKSHDVSKGIDKAAGATRKVVAQVTDRVDDGTVYAIGHSGNLTSDVPNTAAPQRWEGWGTALKPANEPIVLARKPLSEKTVAANVLKWGTGAINIDGCRVEATDAEVFAKNWDRSTVTDMRGGNYGNGVASGIVLSTKAPSGRFPANVITDGSDEVVTAFPSTSASSAAPRNNAAHKSVAKGHDKPHVTLGHNDSGGSAARFFYQAKANKKDRADSKHPTVKPVALMRYLARLITPPGGTILDPFAGSGTTGEAAYLEGFNCYLIEREQEYLADMERRFTTPSDRAIYAAISKSDHANDNDQIDLEEAIAKVLARDAA